MPSVRVLESGRVSYGFAVSGVAPAATPTDVLVLRGATNKIIRVRRLFVGGFAATTAGVMLASIIKRSAANTGGTATNPAAVPLDSGDAVAGAQLALYSANPTGLGAAVGTVKSRRVFLNLATAIQDRIEWFWSDVGAKPFQLNSANEYLALNFGGGAVPAGGALDFELEWTE